MPNKFEQDGYSITYDVYTPKELEAIRQSLSTKRLDKHCVWSKEHAASRYNVYHLATKPIILDQLKPLLGPNIILWGASYLSRVAGQIHPWHTDIESSRPEGGFVTVWVGLEGTNQASALKIVPGSHKLGSTVQQSLQGHDRTRETTTDDDVETWASALSQACGEIVQPDVGNGDAIIFDGRLWHGSSNKNTEATRRSFIFQYASADLPVRIPNFQHLEWPFELLDYPRPPCLLVSGRAEPGVNILSDVPPQITKDLTDISASVYPVDLSAKPDEGEQVKFTHLLRGRSPNLQHISSHFSVLAPGESPHSPHVHVDEEILIILKGEAELRYGDDAGKITSHRVETGDFVYYPAFHQHTIYNSGDTSVVYLMFKWVASRALKTKSNLKLQRGKVESPREGAAGAKTFTAHELFSSPTDHLNQLHCHVSTLQPGGGYDEHRDDHDIAIIVFEGEIQTLGKTAKVGDMVWCSAGELHGMSNVSDRIARYIVFEFHGENCLADLFTFDEHRKKKLVKVFKKRSFKRIVKNIRRLVKGK